MISPILGNNWESLMSVPASASFDVMTILAVVGIAYSLGRQLEIDAIQSAALALVSFFILTPYTTLFTPENSTQVYEVTSLPLKWMGSSGLFLDGVPPTVVKSFEALIPSFVVVTIMFVLNWLVSLTSMGNLQDVIFTFLQTPLLSLGNTLGAMIIAYLFLHFFWFFGINGSSVVGAVFNPVLRALSVENMQAFKDGHEIPNIIFGLPIVLNPIILIPFALVPTINIIISYFAMDWGLVPYTNGIQLPWTTPPIISGFLVSGWQASVLQALLIVLGMAIYYPFIKVLDDQYLREEKEAEELEAEEIDFDTFDFDEI